MDPALLTLVRLHFRGTLRRMLRGVRTVRGLTFLLLGILMMSSWLGSAVYRSVRMRHADPQLVRTVAPFAILGFCLSNLFASAGEKAIVFTGPEVDFLFPGPFSRRALLSYKIFKTSLGVIFTTIVFSILLLRYAGWWPACFVGVWLTIQFMQLFAIAVTLLAQTFGERAYGSTRWIVVAVLVGVAAVAIGPQLSAHLHSGPMELMRQIQATLAGKVLLAPFDVFARTLTAANAGELAMWAGIALLIDIGMLATVMTLDANYLETAAVASQRRYERIQRFRRGGVMGPRNSSGARFHIRPLPWLGGIGPIAWRQMTSAVRNSRALFTVLGILVIMAGTFMYQQRDGKASSLVPLLSTAAWLNVVFVSMLKFDFRDELDRLDVLRSLPIGPLAVAAAELATPVAILTLMQALLVIALALTFHQARPYLLWAAAFAVPFNILLAVIENLLFLMFPVRAVGLIAGDMQLFGRQMVIFMCKFLLMVTGLCIAAGFGLIGYIAGGGSWIGFGAAMWAGLVLVALGLIPLLARAYARFDPSVDTPT